MRQRQAINELKGLKVPVLRNEQGQVVVYTRGHHKVGGFSRVIKGFMENSGFKFISKSWDAKAQLTENKFIEIYSRRDLVVFKRAA